MLADVLATTHLQQRERNVSLAEEIVEPHHVPRQHQHPDTVPSLMPRRLRRNLVRNSPTSQRISQRRRDPR